MGVSVVNLANMEEKMLPCGHIEIIQYTCKEVVMYVKLLHREAITFSVVVGLLL